MLRARPQRAGGLRAVCVTVKRSALADAGNSGRGKGWDGMVRWYEHGVWSEGGGRGREGGDRAQVTHTHCGPHLRLVLRVDLKMVFDGSQP